MSEHGSEILVHRDDPGVHSDDQRFGNNDQRNNDQRNDDQRPQIDDSKLVGQSTITKAVSPRQAVSQTKVAGKLYQRNNLSASNLTQDDVYEYGVPQYPPGQQSSELFFHDSKKSLDNADYRNFEDTISGLILQVELWRRKHLDLKKAYHERAQNEEEMFISLEQRMRILLTESSQASSELRVKGSVNEKQRVRIQQLEEIVHQLQQYQAEVEILEHIHQGRLKELDDWRAKYCELEASILQFRALEITLIDYEGRIDALEKECEHGRTLNQQLVDDKRAIEAELLRANQTIQDFNLDSRTRRYQSSHHQSKLNNAECVADNNNRLKDQLDQLLGDLESSRKSAVDFEAQVLSLQGQLLDEGNLNKLQWVIMYRSVTAELQRSQQTVADQESQLNELRGIVMNLELELQQVPLLEAKFERQEDIHALLTKDTLKLRNEINNLQTQLANLKGIEAQNQDYKRDNAFLQSEIERYRDALRLKGVDIESWRQRNSKLELQNGDLKHTVKLFDKVSMDLRHAQDDYDQLQKSVPLKERRIQEQQSELERLKSLIGDLRIYETEVRRIKAVLQSRDAELQDLRRQVTQLTVKCKELQAIEGERNELQNSVAKLNVEKTVLTNQSRELNAASHKLELVIQKQDLQISQFLIVEKELNSIRTRLEHANKEIDVWRTKHGKLQQDTTILKKNQDLAEQQANFLQRDLTKQKELTEQAKRNLQDSRAKHTQLELDAKDARQQLIDANTKVGTLTSERDKLQNSIHDLQKELENHLLKVRLLDGQLGESKRQSESDKLVLREENLKNSTLVQKFTKQGIDWKERYLKSEQLVNDLQGVDVRLQDSLKRNADLEKESVRLNDELSVTKLDLQRLRQQLDSVSNDLLQLQHVNDDLAKVRANHTAKSKELVTVQAQIPRLHQEIEDLKSQRPVDQNRIAVLESELLRVNQLYQARIRDNEDLRNRCNALEQRIIDLTFLEKRVPELEEKTKSLTDESKRVNGQLSDRIEQAERLLQTLSGQQIDLSTYALLQASYAKLQRVHSTIEGELQATRSRLYRSDEELNRIKLLKNDLELTHQRLALTHDQLKLRVQRQDTLISDLQATLIEKDRLLDEAQVNAAKFKELLRRVAQKEGELAGLTEQYRVKQFSETKLQNQVDQLQKQLSYLIPLQHDNIELNAQVHKDQDVFEDWRSKYTDLSEAKTRDSEVWNDKCVTLSKDLAEYQAQAQQVEQLTNLVNAYETQLKQLHQQHNETVDELNQLKASNIRLELRVSGFALLSEETRKLRDRLRESDATIDDLKLRLSKAESDADELRAFREGLENRIAMLASEIERLGHMLGKKNDEIENLKRTVQRQEEMIVELSPLEGNNRRLEEDLIKQKDQTDAWKEECTVQERLANEAIKQREGLENKIALLSSEIERLRVKVDNRAAEIELQKMQIQELQEHLTDAQQLSGVVNELQSKVNVLGVERDQIVDQYNARIKELNELRNRFSQLELDYQASKLNDLKLRESQAILKGKDAETALYLQKFNEYQAAIDELEQLRGQLENKQAALAAEVDRLNRKAQTQTNENNLMKDHIGVLTTDIDRLTQQNGALIAENNQLRINVPKPQEPAQTTVQVTRRVSSAIRSQLK